MPHSLMSCLLALSALLASVWTSRAHWPEFRGPTGQGLAWTDALPLHWGPESNVVWRQTIPGRGWSSPVVADGRVYLTTAASQGTDGAGPLSLRVLCLASATGRELWQREVFRVESGASARMHRKNSQASPTPVLAGHRLYAHFGPMGTACLDTDGQVLWRQTALEFNPVHGNGGSPVLVDTHLIFSCDGADQPYLAALEATTGKLAWKTPRSEPDAPKKFSFGTPLLIEVNGRRELISPASNMVGGYDPATGRELWKVRYDGYSVVPRPVFGHGLIYISTGFDRPVVMAIRPGGNGDVTDTHVAWTLRRGGPTTPSLLLVDDNLYMVSDGGIASCVDARTGKVHWQERVGGNYSASPLGAGDRIYLQSEEGKGVVLRAGETFEVLAENDLDEPSLASFAVAPQGLLIRTEHHLHLIATP